VVAAEPERKSTRAKAPSSKSADYGTGMAGWTKVDSLLVRSDAACAGSDRVFGFDMDSTLIVTKSGKVFGTSRDDWKWFDASVPRKLAELHKAGYKLVIFSNQGGIGGKGYDETKARMICAKVDLLVAAAGVPVQAFLATAEDQFRKPATAMWDLMVSRFNDGVAPNLADCHYVGDAAGRPAGWRAGAKKDFSCSDRKFAHNVGLTFHTPETYFMGLPEAKSFSWDGINPAELLAKAGQGEVCEGGVGSIVRKGVLELVIFVGAPASGKSTFAKKYLAPNGYVWVNRDTLTTPAKCQKAVQEALAAGKSVVLDNTSPAAAARAEYVRIAQSYKARVRCFRFTTDREICVHLNMFRERQSNGAQPHVPKIGFNLFFAQLEEPSVHEGFDEVKRIFFRVRDDMTAAERQQFAQFV
jgi:bifunctional polynucleotide phosphatase/kinase